MEQGRFSVLQWWYWWVEERRLNSCQGSRLVLCSRLAFSGENEDNAHQYNVAKLSELDAATSDWYMLADFGRIQKPQ